MRTNSFFTKTAAMAAILITGLTISCQENEVPLSQEAALVIEESATDVYFEDADDMAGLSVASASETSTGVPGGKMSADREITVSDTRFNCAIVTVTIGVNSTVDIPYGTILIDFGDGCEDPRGNVRKGKIKITFNGKRFMPGSSLTIELIDYYINDIHLEGTKVLTNLTPNNEAYPKFKSELTGGKATWPDGTDATREHCIVREWIRATNPVNDQLHIEQCGDVEYAATGTNRRGVEYRMIIEEKLVYKRGCPIAVSGVKTLIEVNTGKEITIDYGDGECDRIIVITVNGASRTVEAKR